MGTSNSITRRRFLSAAAAGAAAGPAATSMQVNTSPDTRYRQRPREVRVTSICMDGMPSADSRTAAVNRVMGSIRGALACRPDVLCLPEKFNTIHSTYAKTAAEEVETLSGPTITRLADLARDHRCYIIAPIGIDDGGTYYNSAVLIDRGGKVAGRYDKLFPTEGEIRKGYACGTRAPVFDTDFGRIGIQICFDVNFPEGWQQLSDQNAELVFWPSAYAGGRILHAKAWEYEYYVVGSTWRTPTTAADVSGDVLQRSGKGQPWIVADLNLERKRFWQHSVREIHKIQETYGAGVKVDWCHDPLWWVLECRRPDLTIAQVANEFNLYTPKERFRRYRAFLRRQG